MATLFTRIIAKELPAHFVWRDDQAVAFLAKDPLAAGHTLVVPIAEVDHWIDAPPPLLAHLTGVAHTVAGALQSAFQPRKVGLMIAGLEVPHLHVHLVPIRSVNDMDFTNAARDVPDADLAAAAAKIRESLRKQGRREVAES